MFNMKAEFSYDAATGILLRTYWDYFFGNANTYSRQGPGLPGPFSGLLPADLSFSINLKRGGNLAPTAATFEVFEFTLG